MVYYFRDEEESRIYQQEQDEQNRKRRTHMENPEIFNELLEIRKNLKEIADKQLLRMTAFFVSVIMVAVIALAIFFVIAVDKITTRLEAINKNPAFSVSHGWYQDPSDPKRSGLKMIRVSEGGFILVAPVNLEAKTAEKTPEPEKPSK